MLYAATTRIGSVSRSVCQFDNDSKDVVDDSGIACESWYYNCCVAIISLCVLAATNHLLGRGLCSQSRSCRLRQGSVPELGLCIYLGN